MVTSEVRAERSRQATEAAVALARAHGVTVTEPQVLNDLFSVMVHLRPAQRLAPFVAEPDGEMQPIHGDAHPGNLIATRDGLVWIDFEDVCRGPVEWDLATMMDPAAVAAHHRPDPDLLARCTDLRALQVAWCLLALYPELGDLEGWDAGLRSMLGTLADRQALTPPPDG